MERSENHQVARMFIPDLLFATPVEGTSVSSDANQLGITNFVGVSGVGFASGEYSADNKKSGIFGYDRITKIEDIKDGPANTIALLLIKQNKNHPWIAGGGASIAGISEGSDALAPFLILEKSIEIKRKSILASQSWPMARFVKSPARSLQKSLELCAPLMVVRKSTTLMRLHLSSNNRIKKR